ncbi:hypothetical protein VI817_008059 [Penicillium citrinum]|nr:hypothetical protein VI817_008059 [Penicillium citrinum]
MAESQSETNSALIGFEWMTSLHFSMLLLHVPLAPSANISSIPGYPMCSLAGNVTMEQSRWGDMQITEDVGQQSSSQQHSHSAIIPSVQSTNCSGSMYAVVNQVAKIGECVSA